MKILVVQETDWIESLPLPSHQIIESLSKRGHEIRVIDFEARWKHTVGSRSVRSRVFQDVHRTDPASSISLIRPGMLKIPGIARLTSIPSQFKVIFEQIARWCDVVVLYSVPTNGVIATLLSNLMDKPVVFHSFDILHRMTGNRFLLPATWAFERLVYPRVAKVIVISPSLLKYMKGIGISNSSLEMLPPAVNTSLFNPGISGESVRKELRISNDDKVVLFSGWLYEFSGLDMILAGMPELIHKFPRVRLVICGDGPLLPKLRTMQWKLGLDDHVIILGRRPYAEMPQIMAAADVCINPFLPDVRSDFAFPSKLAEYMASGKAVISTDLSGTKSMLGEESGVTLTPHSEFLSSLGRLLADVELQKKSGQDCRNYCEQHFTLDSIVSRFEEILRQTVRATSYN